MKSRRSDRITSRRVSSSALNAALSYARRGWAVFPVNGKAPLTPRGFKDATTDEVMIRAWWSAHPNANVGIATGASSLVVIDIDGDEGRASWGVLGLSVDTLSSRTGNGQHLIFHANGTRIKSSTSRFNRLGKGIDVRANGGYIVAPPSIHPNGSRYEWEPGHSPDDHDPADIPPDLLRLLRSTKRAKRNPKKVEKAIREGTRNTTLTSLAGSMRRRGMGEDAIQAALLRENRAKCRPPLPDAEVRQIVASVAQYEPTLDQPERFYTDLGNAQRLVARHGHDLHYVPAWGRWLCWDGRRWAVDDTGEAIRRAKETVRGMYGEAAQIIDESERRDLINHARRSESRQRIDAMIALAQSEPGIAVTPDQLDADPWLLNVENGTLNLKTPKLQEHDRANLITKIAPVDYNAKAKHPTWDKFLRESTGNRQLAAFLGRAVGSSLTGDTRDERLFFIHGPTATGKSTFIEAIKGTLGDYALTADFETFLSRSGVGGARNDIARLAGARFVASLEVDDGKALAEGLIKQLTGGDVITARFLYAEQFEFRPQFKLWLAANHEPKADDADGALWRRILRVPFDREIPANKRDPEIKATLRDDPKARAAILAWAVKGLRDWRKNGLGLDFCRDIK